MANYEATKYDFDGANLTGIQGVNTGIIVPWSDSSIPSGFLECDGSNVSRTTYADLFGVIGTTYGAGDGSTTFGLPDLVDKCCQNESPTKTLATSGGANTTATTGNVAATLGNTTITTATMAPHTHNVSAAPGGRYGGPDPKSTGAKTTSPSTGGGGAHNHPFTGNFTGDSNSVLQPYLTLIYIIKT